jgi:hypothetical protein
MNFIILVSGLLEVAVFAPGAGGLFTSLAKLDDAGMWIMAVNAFQDNVFSLI